MATLAQTTANADKKSCKQSLFKALKNAMSALVLMSMFGLSEDDSTLRE